jgi:FkbM family methyltransferase
MKFDQVEQNKEVQRWFSDGGDYELRLDYNLDDESVVFDLGGYQGWFAENINQKFKSKIYVFEPSIPFYRSMDKKFRKNFNIKLFNYGLSDVNADLNLVAANDGSYLAEYGNDSSSGDIEIVKIKSFSETYKNLGIDNIDLLKINVEGAEYSIMNNIFENNLQTKIKNFQIQFHHISSECDNNLTSIRNKLSETHTQKWNYEWVWESWEINE